MSKQRMIRDSFWTDSYIEKITPDEKLLFLYLLTNPLANIAGIYEVRTKRIGFETGYDIEVVENILNRFVRDKKLLRFNDWVCLTNHIKNQSLNPSIIEGCKRIFNELPIDVGQAVTGWVQAGLLNLTILNLTLLNSTIPNVAEKPATAIVVKSVKTAKEKFGEFQNVLLEEEEYKKLVEGLNQSAVDFLVAELDCYIESTGKKYKSHYATLQNWARRKINEVKTQKNTLPNKSTADFSK